MLRITPDRITFLKKDEIFVFGSNIRGIHAGGAAYFAFKHFGAIWGQGEGLQGSSYALPTMEGLENMILAIQRFIRFAAMHSEKTFLVTPVGCGIAGYRPEQIGPMFKEATKLENVYLPASFWIALGEL